MLYKETRDAAAHHQLKSTQNKSRKLAIKK